MCPFGEGLGQQVERGDENEGGLAVEAFGDPEGGKGFAGAAGHDQLTLVVGLQAFQDVAYCALLVGAWFGTVLLLGSLQSVRVAWPGDGCGFQFGKRDEGDVVVMDGSSRVGRQAVGGGDKPALGKGSR